MKEDVEPGMRGRLAVAILSAFCWKNKGI